MARGILEQIDASIKNELSIRSAGDIAPGRNSYIQLTFDSFEDAQKGHPVFKKLLAPHVPGLMWEHFEQALQAVAAKKTFKNQHVGVVQDGNKIQVQFFADLPLHTLSNWIKITREAITDAPNACIRTSGNNQPFVPILCSARSLADVRDILSALGQAHDAKHFSANSIMTASEGIGRAISQHPASTPAVLIAESTFHKIAVAERFDRKARGEGRG